MRTDARDHARDEPSLRPALAALGRLARGAPDIEREVTLVADLDVSDRLDLPAGTYVYRAGTPMTFHSLSAPRPTPTGGPPWGPWGVVLYPLFPAHEFMIPVPGEDYLRLVGDDDLRATLGAFWYRELAGAPRG